MSVQATKQRARTLVAAIAAALIAAASSAPARRRELVREELLSCSARASIPQLPACDDSWALSTIQAAVCHQGRPVLELRPADHELRPHPRGRLPALGRRHHPAPVLQRPRADLRRPLADGPLFDRRRRRHDRRELGRAVVRGRRRPQLGLQPGLRGGGAVARLTQPLKRASPSGQRSAPLTHAGASPPITFHCYFVLDLFSVLGKSSRRRFSSSEGGVPWPVSSFAPLHSRSF